jgi:hypothetical protein
MGRGRLRPAITRATLTHREPHQVLDLKEMIVQTTAGLWRVTLIAVLLASGCDGSRSAGDAQADSAAVASDTGPAPASCLPLVPDMRGSLLGQRELAQREARRMRVSGAGVARSDSGGTVTITPACGSHAFNEDDLARGQFVARLTMQGANERFSRFPNDTVYWWVYLDLTSGTPVFHSEFLSTAATTDADRAYVRRGDFVIRCKAAGERPKAEMAGWEPVHEAEACPASEARFRLLQQVAASDSGTAGSGGTSPWFGCKLGCCQSSRPVLQ